MAINAGSIFSEVRLELSKLRGDIRQMNAALDQSNADSKKKATGFSKIWSGGFNAFKLAGVGAVIAVGLAMKKFVTESIKAASDAEEITAKFATTFNDVAIAAQASAEALAEGYGIAESTAKDLLSATGDMLSGFGATDRQALALSTSVQELAVDLASFTNFSGGAQGASVALTKALLGERESVKSLGISILDADVKQRLFEKGLNELTGTALKMAKAEVTLELAYEQSANALGDYERTQDSYANVARRSQEATKELREEVGEKLLPTVTKIRAKWTEMIEQMVDAIKQSNDLKSALDALAEGKELETFQALALETEKVQEAESKLMFLKMQGQQVDLETLQLQKQQNMELIEMLKTDEQLNFMEIANLEALNQQIDGQIQMVEMIKEEVAQAEQAKIEIQEAQEYAALLESFFHETAVDAVSTAKALKEQKSELLAMLELSGKVFDEEAAVEASRKAAEAFDALEEKNTEAAEQSHQNRLNALEPLEKEIQLLREENEVIQEQININAEAGADFEALAQLRNENRQSIIDLEREQQTERLAFIDEIQEAERARIEENTLAIDAELEANRAKNEELARLEAERLVKQQENLKNLKTGFDITYGAITSSVLSSIDSQLKGAEEGSEEQKALLKRQFKAQQATSAANAGIATFEGAVQAYKALAGIPLIGPALGIAAAAAVGIFGAIKVGNILSEPAPAFQTGGIVPQPAGASSGRDSVTARLTPGEVVLNAAQQGGLASQLAGDGGDRKIVVEFIPEGLFRMVQDGMDNQEIIQK